MKNRINQRLEEITAATLIVGVDIAKTVHWARFVDYRGIEHGKAITFKCDQKGFESIVSRIKEICNQKYLTDNNISDIADIIGTAHHY